jgi:hypothetical protein
MRFSTNALGKQEVLASGSRNKTLIGRVWSGRTRKEVAEEYLGYLYEHGVLPLEKKPGMLGIQLFRRFRGEVAEFTVISYWSSMGAMQAMHPDGGDVRRVAHLAKDPEYLLELPEFVELTELHANDWELDGWPPS